MVDKQFVYLICYFEKSKIRPLYFFSLFWMSAHIRFRPRITKEKAFFCLSRALDCCRLPKKNSQFRDIKKHSEKNKFILWDKKYFSSYVFFCLFFFFALINFKICQKVFFLLSPSLTFPEICPMFFFISLTFPKIGSMYFFKCFFSTLSHQILDFFWSKTKKLKQVALTWLLKKLWDKGVRIHFIYNFISNIQKLTWKWIDGVFV